MGYDNRFPHMFRVQHAPGLCAWERQEALRVARTICGRCLIRCSYNAITGGLFFHYTPEPDSGPFEMSFKPIGEEGRRVADSEIDDVVRLIQYGKASRRDKERWGAKAQQVKEDEKARDKERFKDERRPAVLDYAAFKDKKRRGVSKLISA